MLPATFDTDPKLRISKLTLGIIAIAILAAGFSLTGLTSLAVKNPIFQAEAIYLPSATSCSIGLLTIFYDFLLSPRYIWNTAATVVTIAAGISTIVYGSLLIWTQRRINRVTKQTAFSMQTEPLRGNSSTALRDDQWGDAAYYSNYVQNMYPASLSHRPAEEAAQTLTDEELQRQQMLMLLQPQNQVNTPSNASQSTFRIDWQGQEDQEDDAPASARGFYRPRDGSVSEVGSAFPTGSSMGQGLRPWDGVWRGPGAPLARTVVGSSRLGSGG